MYERFSGPATSASTAGFIDISSSGPAVAPFTDDSAIVQPRQTGGDTIDSALDGRPTDAVWRGNNLWFVATATADPGGGNVDEVRVTRIVTGVGTPTAGGSALLATSGVDSYMGGIGVSGNGTPFVTYTTSSPSSDPVAHFASLVGDVFNTEHVIRSSDSPYSGERWGDYAGVAFDPLAAGAAWIVGETAAGDGTWRTTVVRADVDSDLPSTPGVPFESIVAPSTLALYIPTRIAWGVASDPTSGIAGYQVLTNEGGGGFGSPARTTGNATYRNLIPTDTYAFRIEGIDAVGNHSLDSTGATFTPLAYSNPTLSVTGPWSTWSSGSYFGGTSRWSSAKGATATVSFTGRAFALETYTGPARGSVQIYVDSKYAGTVSTYSTTNKGYQLVFARSWATSGSHKVRFVIVGTPGHPHVDIDGLIVLR